MDLGRTKEQVANKSMNLQYEKEITNYEQKAEKIRGKRKQKE